MVEVKKVTGRKEENDFIRLTDMIYRDFPTSHGVCPPVIFLTPSKQHLWIMQICCLHDVNSISAWTKHGTSEEDAISINRERHFDLPRTSLRPAENVTSMNEACRQDHRRTAQEHSLHGARKFPAGCSRPRSWKVLSGMVQHGIRVSEQTHVEKDLPSSRHSLLMPMYKGFLAREVCCRHLP